MSRFNPSPYLTLAEVDRAVDLILKGRQYCSPKELATYPSPKTAMQLCLGQRNWQNMRDYVTSRWGLSSTGTTRRINNLTRKIESVCSELGPDNDLVWKIGCWKGTLGHVSAATPEAARELGWTMFAWTQPALAGKTSHDLYVEKHGIGGWEAAVRGNVTLVNGMRDNINSWRKQIEDLHASIATTDTRIQSLLQSIDMCNAAGGDAAPEVEDDEESS